MSPTEIEEKLSVIAFEEFLALFRGVPCNDLIYLRNSNSLIGLSQIDYDLHVIKSPGCIIPEIVLLFQTCIILNVYKVFARDVMKF